MAEAIHKQTDSVNVMSLAWDNLIILDACRYDTFEELNTLPGQLRSMNSVSSSTGEWVKKTFTRKYPDVFCISANPYVGNLLIKKICGFVPFEIEAVFDYSWDKEAQTIFPEAVNKAVLDTLDKRKRRVVYYMQPHHPFVGPKRIKAAGFTQWKHGDKEFGETVWQMLENGSLTQEEVWEAYKSNLEYVLGCVAEILPCLEGRTLITSDHGNCVGEHGVFGHPPNLEYEELLRVPLFEVTQGIHIQGAK